MNWIRTVRKTPFVEVALVILATFVVTLITVRLQMVDHITALEGASGAGADLADFGPGLLVLSSGFGLMTYRRWRESETERVLHDAASSSRLRSEQRYRSLVEVSPDPVLVVRDMEIAYVNPASMAFFGASDPDQLIGHSVLELLPPEAGDEARAWLDAVLASGDPSKPVERPLLRLDGTQLDAETAVVRTPYEGGFALQVVVRDISARRAADDAMTRYQALAENTQDILIFAAPDGQIVDCNRAAVLRYGYTKEELTSMTVYDLRAPGYSRPTGVDLTDVPGDTARFDQVQATKDGEIIDLSVSAQRMSVGGQDIVVSVCRDVTEKRKSDRALRDSEARYRGLIDMSPSPVFVYGRDYTVVFANQAALDLLRAHDRTEVLGHDIRAFSDPDARLAAADSFERLDREGSTPFFDMRLVRLDGTPVAVQMAINSTKYDGAEGYTSVMQDVSRLKDLAEDLKRTTEDTISAMARLAETRDPYTSGHQERVSRMACRIGARMGLDEAMCETIRLAGIVHDIGKMNISAEILSKPGRLTEAEFSLIKEHAQLGYELLRPIDFPWPIAEIVREHHERLDGSGYPRGLKNGDICIEARVIAVADVVEAISSHRPYRPALTTDFALSVIRDGRGTLYDARAVDAALNLADDGALFDARGQGDSPSLSAA